MKRPALVAVTIALVSACSDSSDRRAPADEDNLTRPLEVARVDTTRPLEPVELKVARSADAATKAKPRRARPQPKKPAPPPVASAEITAPEPDTTVRGYAPDPADTPAPDTAAAVDSVQPTPPPADISPPSAAARTLPIGTEIHAALDDSINSRTDSAGRVVTAVVMENVPASDGKTLIAAGAPVRFTVTRLSAAKSKSAQGRLALQVDGIGIGGELRKVSADVRPVPHELRGRGVGGSEAAKVGVGAVGGAVLGRVIGGDTRGAVIGGVVGAAGGAVVASQTASRDVVVKARTPVVFVLTEPLVAY
jgi:hypothetical protein